ncbi:MAG: DUF3786 domain-containing protein [Candidatus Hydrogenedentes bacterium]|nr:DUF3786 domain-containing protein [Candidatus Hydrogenedentota bacterium]
MRNSVDIPEPGHLPEPPEYAAARDLAWAEITSRNPIDIAANADVTLVRPLSPPHVGNRAVYKVPLLDDVITVDVETRRMRRENGSDLSPWRVVLVLHYMLGAQPGRVSTDWLTFRELDSGAFYLPAFESRSVNILKPLLGPHPELLPAAAAPLRGTPIELGDFGVHLRVMPKVDVAVVVWAGDDLIEPSVNMLFGRTATEIFPTEDIAVIGGMVAVGIAKNIWNKQQTS